MERTENLYKELKSKVQGLVEFMVANEITSADIKLDTNKNFTLCNVRYNSENETKDEFLYLFKASEISNAIKEKSLCNATANNKDTPCNLEDESKVASKTEKKTEINTPSEAKVESEVSKTEVKTEVNFKNSSENSSEATKPIEVEIKQEIATEKDEATKEDELVDDTNKQVLDKEKHKGKEPEDKKIKRNNKTTKEPINFKDEFIFQKETIISVLKEYNLIS